MSDIHIYIYTYIHIYIHIYIYIYRNERERATEGRYCAHPNRILLAKNACVFNIQAIYLKSNHHMPSSHSNNDMTSNHCMTCNHGMSSSHGMPSIYHMPIIMNLLWTWSMPTTYHMPSQEILYFSRKITRSDLRGVLHFFAEIINSRTCTLSTSFPASCSL